MYENLKTEKEKSQFCFYRIDFCSFLSSGLRQLQSAVNLTRAQATGAGVDILGGTVYNSLNALNIGLPSTVRTTMRMRNLDAKGYAFATTITLCHLLHLLYSKLLTYNTKFKTEMQVFFKKSFFETEFCERKEKI